MHQVAVNMDQAGAIVVTFNYVIVPDLLKEGARRMCHVLFLPVKSYLNFPEYNSSV
jgi:hypothetical protein